MGDVEVGELHVAAPAERVDPCDLASDAARTARSLRGELVERERGEGAAALEAGGGGRSARRLDAKSCIELQLRTSPDMRRLKAESEVRSAGFAPSSGS